MKKKKMLVITVYEITGKDGDTYNEYETNPKLDTYFGKQFDWTVDDLVDHIKRNKLKVK